MFLLSLPARHAQASTLVLLSSRSVNGLSNSYDNATAVIQDGAGNMLVSGVVTDPAGGINAWLGKYASDWTFISSRTLNGAAGSDDYGAGVRLGPDGNVYWTGVLKGTDPSRQRQLFLAKYSPTLDLLAFQLLPSTVAAMGNDLEFGPSGSLYVVGYSSGGNEFLDLWAGKFDANLVLLSSVSLSGTAHMQDEMVSVAVSPTEDVYACGYTFGAGTSGDIWLGKFDSSLSVVSTVTYTTAGSYMDQCQSVRWTPSGLVTGGAVGSAAGYDIWFAKWTEALVLSASSTWNYGSNEQSIRMKIGPDGNLYSAGPINIPGHATDAFISRFSPAPDFVLLSSASFNGSANSDDGANGIFVTTMGAPGIYVVGTDYTSSQAQNGWLARYALPWPDQGQSLAAAYLSSAALTYTSGGFQGYRAEASTASNFTGTILSSETLNASLLRLSPQGLSANTTYYFRVGALYDTYYSLPSQASAVKSTLANAVSGPQAAVVYAASATFNWQALPAAPQSASAEGYVLEASTASDFSGTVYSSRTPGVGLSTLTLTGLWADATYYFRVGSVNWAGGADYAASGSLVTGPESGPGCGLARSVAKSNAPYSTIQSAVNSLPSSLGADVCVVVRDTQTYAEQVTVQGFTNNGWRLKIMADPGFVSSAPVVSPPAASQAGFVVRNASVTLQGLTVRGANAMPYGIQASSPNITISSVSVDSSGKISAAGIWLSSWSTVAYTSVTVQSARGLYTSGTQSLVVGSSMSANGGPNTEGIYIDGGSSNTVTDSYVANGGDDGFHIANGSRYNSVVRSTVTGGSMTTAIQISNSSYTAVSDSYISNPGGNGIYILYGSLGTTIARSTAVSNVINYNGMAIIASSATTVIDCRLINRAGRALTILNDSGSLIVRSTMTGDASGTLTAAYVTASSSAFIANSYLQGSSAVLVTGSTGTTLVDSVLVATRTGGVGLTMTGGSAGLALSSATVMAGPGGIGVQLLSGNSGLILLASDTIKAAGTAIVGMSVAAQTAGTGLGVSSVTFSPLPAGSTAISLLGGTFVSTFPAVYFGAGTGVNVDGTGLAAGSRITMLSAAGPKAGPYFEYDPWDRVDWEDQAYLLGSAGTPLGTALGVSSISWTWSAVSGATAYSVYLSSKPSNSVGGGASTAFTQTGLLPNTTAAVAVAAFSASGFGPLAPAPTAVWTLAYPASATAVSHVYATSATVSWGPNGNPAWTAAEVERSTDGAGYSTVFAGAATCLTDYSLLGCTDYYYRVRNRNGAGAYTAYDGVVHFTTQGSTPAAPSGLVAAPQEGNRILLTWDPSPSEGITGYRLYYDAGTGAIDYASPLAVLTPSATSWTTGVLASSAAYRFGLRAVNRCGVEERNLTTLASAGSLNSLSGVRAVIKIPQTGKRVHGNEITVMAELAAGDPAQTRQVLFQYKASAAAVWTDIPPKNIEHPNPDSSFPYFIHWDVTGLAHGSYDLRAAATDIFGTADAAPSAVTIVVDSVDADIVEGTQPDGTVMKQEKVNNSVVSRLQAADATGTGITQLELPAGSLTASTVTVSVVNDPPDAPAPPAGVKPAGVVTEIALDAGLSQLAPGRTATVGLTYPDANGDGIVDGTDIRVEDLRMYSAANAAGPWQPDVVTVVDPVTKTVKGKTSHFSFFALFAKPLAADLSAVRVYPIPYMPNGSDPDQGVPFSPGNPNSGIIFDNLPGSVKIKIFTITGRLVADFSTESSNGRIQWDVRNGDGAPVATGGYLAVISSPGQPKVVKRLLIVR